MMNRHYKRPVNYYDILQVDRRASVSRIKESYRMLVRALHPDIQQANKCADEDRLRLLNEAYSCLRDPKARKAYDMVLDRQVRLSKQKSSRQKRKAANDNASSGWAKAFFDTLGEIFWPLESIHHRNDKTSKPDKRING